MTGSRIGVGGVIGSAERLFREVAGMVYPATPVD
jgi:hypothetical protein